MATLYWGPSGGSSTGTWDLTTATNWFTDVGRTTPATAAPTAVDDVVFDANSDAGGIFTVTIGASGALCRDVTISGLDQVMTLAGAGAWDIYGSMLLPATNLTRTFTGVITFRATTTGKTVTTNGVSLVTGANLVFDGVGGEWTLGSALTSSNVTVTNGSFISGNQNITAGGGIISNNSNVRSISLGSSVFTSGGSAPVQLATATNLTFNAGTSTFTLSAASPTFAGGGLTFYNVSFTSNAAGTATITGANTFNNLTFTSRSATGLRFISIGDNQTVGGTLTFGTANTAIRRMSVASSVVGVQRTITAATVATIADVDFRDIKAAGASAPWSGTRIGDCQGNDGTSITFTAGALKYWNLVAGGNWSATAWALSSGGAVDVNNFPLAQDSIVIEDTGLLVASTITVDQAWNIPALSFASRTLAMTFATGTTTPTFYGDLTLDADVTYTGTGNLTFAKQSSAQLITSAGKTLTQPLTFNNGVGTARLADNLTIGSTLTTTLTTGTLDLNNQTLSTGAFSSSNSNVRSIAFGTGNITVTGNNTTIWSVGTATNLICTGNLTVNCTYAGAVGTRTFSQGTGSTQNNVVNIYVLAGSDIVTGVINVKNLNFTGFSGTLGNSVRIVYGDLVFSGGMTLTAGSNRTEFASTSGVQQVTTAGLTLDFPLTFNGVGGTFAFQDALTQGSTRNFTITNGTVQLKNGVASTVGNFLTSGTNQKFLQSTTPGSQATLSEASGTVNASYLTIRDINATGGATWNAFVDQFNVDAGNNDGWDFGISPIVGGNEYTYQLRSFTQPRRF